MSHNINITNLSGHDQEFEVHGWNNNQNMTVPVGQTSGISAADGSAGAIIALHYGFEGEQAEITKDGFGGKSIWDEQRLWISRNSQLGNDFIDMSNIMGAGGNMTVQQVISCAGGHGHPGNLQ